MGMIVMAIVVAVPVLMNFFFVKMQVPVFFRNGKVSTKEHDCKSGQEGTCDSFTQQKP